VSSKVAPERRFVSCGRRNTIPAVRSRRSIVGSSPAGAVRGAASIRSRVFQHNPPIPVIRVTLGSSHERTCDLTAALLHAREIEDCVAEITFITASTKDR
jgi:hypothetical protein